MRATVLARPHLKTYLLHDGGISINVNAYSAFINFVQELTLFALPSQWAAPWVLTNTNTCTNRTTEVPNYLRNASIQKDEWVVERDPRHDVHWMPKASV